MGFEVPGPSVVFVVVVVVVAVDVVVVVVVVVVGLFVCLFVCFFFWGGGGGNCRRLGTQGIVLIQKPKESPRLGFTYRKL